jgi:type I restriction enzyme, S subunit
MMKGWEYVRLSEYCDISPGYAFDSSRFTDNEEDIHLVKGENLHQGYIDWTNAKKWNLGDWDSLKKFHLRKSDIVVAMDRPWIEAGLKWSIIKEKDPKALLVQRVARLRSRKALSQYFLRYVIGSKVFEGYIKPIVTGVNVPHISGTQIGSFKFYLPRLPIQRKIAAVLSAYDDLIENNNHRIAILEKMAEELYREWFVRLRFPGHEKSKFIKGVPEGWEVKRIGELFRTASGGTPSRAEPRNYEGNINWFKTGELKQIYIFESEEKISQLGLESSSAKIFPANAVVMAMYCAMADISILANSGATNQACCVFFPIDPKISAVFTFYLIKEALPHMIAFAHGAAQQNLSQELIKSHKVFLPNVKLIEAFTEKIDALHRLIKFSMEKTYRLKSSRNRLLTRLMSGKIDVANLDIRFPASM